MSGRKAHLIAGGVCGAAVAVYSARRLPGDWRLFETIGGALGGLAGGATPDVLEPATSPNHRGLAHGGVAAFALVKADWAPFIDRLRAGAEVLLQRSADPALPQSTQEWLRFQAALCLIGAGAVSGFVAGYASHLILDMATPSSLPVLW